MTITRQVQTHEQRRATEELASIAGRLRVTRDAEGWPIIPGRVGTIEHEHVLTVYTDRPRLITRLLALPGVTRHQVGDFELRALITAEALPSVARMIKAKRKRVDPDSAVRMRALNARRATSQALQGAPGCDRTA